jgi:hypothetical protein
MIEIEKPSIPGARIVVSFARLCEFRDNRSAPTLAINDSVR